MTRRGLYWLGMAVLSVLLVRAVWVVPYLPTTDGPQHIFSVHARNHYADPGAIYRAYFEPASRFAYLGFDLPFRPFEKYLGWRNGLRVMLSAMVLALAWGFAALVFAIEPRRRWLAYLGFPLAWTWHIYMGFFAFTIGTSVQLLLLAYALRATTITTRARVCLAVGLLLQASTHVFTALMTGVVLGLVLLLRAKRGARILEVGKVLVMGAPAGALLVAATRFSPQSTQILNDDWTSLDWNVLPRVVFPGPNVRAWMFCALVLGALLLAGYRALKRALSRDELALLATAVGSTLLLCFAPRDLEDWAYFSPRFAPLASYCALVLFPMEKLGERSAKALVGCAAAIFVVCALCLVHTAAFHRTLAAGCADAIDGLSAPVERHGVHFAVRLESSCGVPSEAADSDVPFLLPLRHIVALYAVAQGGSVAPRDLHAGSPAIHAFTIRKGAPVFSPEKPPIWFRLRRVAVSSEAFRTDAAFRRDIVTQYALVGTAYESMMVMGATEPDVALLRDRGYHTDWQQGKMLLAHFEPCPVEVVLPKKMVDVGATFDVGMVPESDTFVSAAAGGARLDASGLARLVIARAPCGAIWVRARVPAAERGCANAGVDGKIRATISRAERTVRCSDAEPVPGATSPD